MARQLSAAPEAEDSVVIGIDENDIKAGIYPVPNRDLAKCSEFSRATSQGQLVSICLDLTADPGYAELAKILQTPQSCCYWNGFEFGSSMLNHPRVATRASRFSMQLLTLMVNYDAALASKVGSEVLSIPYHCSLQKSPAFRGNCTWTW